MRKISSTLQELQRQTAASPRPPNTMKMIRFFILTVLAVMTADAISRGCKGTEEYPVSVFYYWQGQFKIKTITLQRCVCMEWEMPDEDDPMKVYYINTKEKNICAFDTICSLRRRTEYNFERVYTHNTEIKKLTDLWGKVRSFEYCGL